jgi:flagellar hook protein FlgE
MALIQSLNTGISGMRAQQRRVEITGNNIANVSTTAYKSGRALFHTLFSHTLSAGSAPSGNLGGIDPIQFGVGVKLADTSQDWTQGALTATGLKTDIAINGDGFFILNDEHGNPIYTRDGSFSINPSYLLHNPSNGYIVQGYGIDSEFNINVGGPLENIRIPIGQLTIAQETSKAFFSGNLDASGDAAMSGTGFLSEALYDIRDDSAAVTGTPLEFLARDVAGTKVLIFSGLSNGDEITFSLQKGDRHMPERTFTYAVSGMTLDDLKTFIQDTAGINDGTWAGGVTVVFTSGAAAGKAAKVTAATATTLEFDNLDVPPAVGDSYSVHEPAGVDILANGKIQIAGNVGTAHSISDLTFMHNGSEVKLFGDNADETAIGESLTTNITVYDSLGTARQVQLTFVFKSSETGGPNTFTWTAESTDDTDSDRIVGSGSILFDTDGQYLGIGQGSTGISIDLAANPTSSAGVTTPFEFMPDFSRLTGFGSPNDGGSLSSTVNLTDQNGFQSGTLQDFAVNTDGTIVGIFSNGLTRNLGQLVLARFPNNNGLIHEGSNLYRQGVNAGVCVTGAPGSGARGVVRNGFLEESNVDLAKQFTDLIVGQRAFQANARTITVSDQMLQELVNLI